MLLAGFWLHKENGFFVVNIEPKKAASIPLTFLYPGDDENELKDILLEVLPEVEPRLKDLTDTVNRYIRL